MCQPVRWYEGTPSPVKAPGDVDMIIFRENSEDVYAGIEWEAGSEGVAKVMISWSMKWVWTKSDSRILLEWNQTNQQRRNCENRSRCYTIRSRQ